MAVCGKALMLVVLIPQPSRQKGLFHTSRASSLSVPPTSAKQALLIVRNIVSMLPESKDSGSLLHLL